MVPEIFTIGITIADKNFKKIFYFFFEILTRRDFFSLAMQGEKQKRLEGDAYWDAINELCDAVKSIWPDSLLQFEDFETQKAFAILERRRCKQLCFNDDIQGTGAVVVAGIINGFKIQNTDPSDVRILFFGAGASAVGVAEAIAAYLETEAGVPRARARKAIFLVDSKGLVYENRGDDLPSHKKLFARTDKDLEEIGFLESKGTSRQKIHDALKDLKSIVAAVKPHALVGLSAAGPSWNEDVVKELCKHVEQPLLFPLSNPTDKAEITAEHAVKWSGGAAIFAAGSPFDPVKLPSSSCKKKDMSSSSSSSSDSEEEDNKKKKKKRAMVPGQANNVFIFPGIGFGAVMSKASCVSDAMFTAAAKALAGTVSEKELKMGQTLYPKMASLRETSAAVAAAVAKEAWESGISGLDEVPQEGWVDYIKKKMWSPEEVVAGGIENVEQPEE